MNNNQETEQVTTLSPREEQLLKELHTLTELADRVAQKLSTTEQTLYAREAEVNDLRRSMIELKEENQHLKEVLQTWRQRLDAVLNQLKAIN
ncbi:MAG: hypothetical protein J6M93_02715 [Succinivibrio sp.]|nr:hypothetical protein [Succinivibrio sp.]